MRRILPTPSLVHRLIVIFLYRISLKTLFYLKVHSHEHWREIGEFVAKNESIGLGEAPRTSYKPTNRKALETPAGSGFPADTERHTPELISLPRWTREIQPFLMNQLSPHTRRAYQTDLRQFLWFLEGKIDVASLVSLRPEQIILFRKYLEEGRLTGRPMEKTTINRKLAVVKSFLNWLRANQVISDNPAQLVKGFPQSQESSLKGLSDAEARKMLTLPNRNSRSGAMHYAILSCLLYLGLRKGELIALKMGDLGVERGISVIKVRGKGHRVRVLPLTKSVQAALDHYFFACSRNVNQPDEPVFIPCKNPRTRQMVKPLNPNAITYMVVRYARKAGVLKPISPHSCRATCISNALDRRATHRSVQHLAGWSTPLMIQRYDKRREELANSAAFIIDYGVDAESRASPA